MPAATALLQFEGPGIHPVQRFEIEKVQVRYERRATSDEREHFS
jgi:hypothetical protein